MNVGDFPLTTLVETTRDDSAWCEVTDSCYAWHVGALASLTFDSAVESVRGLRSESGQPRVLIFTAAHLSLELEVMADLVVGQIVPPGPGEIVVETPDGTTFRTEADDIGLFDFSGLPRGQLRLRCETPDGNLVTDWVCL
jgi:hypothetical protein